jgi:uncharacterized protein (TIGR02145 family)
MNRNRTLIFSLLALLIASNAFTQVKSVKIGNQIWMSENLNKPLPGSWTFNGTKENGAKYGRLYTWNTAKNACPAGWHLPSEHEWSQLIATLGGEEEAGRKLKVSGSSGFDALLGGYSNGASFWFLDSYGGFWTSSSQDSEHAWYVFITKKDNSVTKTFFSKTYGFSVRCVKNK